MATSDLADLAGKLGTFASNQPPGSAQPGAAAIGEALLQAGTEGVGEKSIPPVPFPGKPEKKGWLRQIIAKATVGKDSRERVQNTNPFPYRAVCHLVVTYASGPGFATGFLIDPGVVVTAAHVLWHPQAGKAEKVLVVPARQQAGYRVSQMAFSQDGQLKTCADWGQPAFEPWFDYAAILLADHQKFRPFGVLSYAALNTGQIDNLISQGYQCGISGYPAKVRGDDAPMGSQWWAKGALKERGDRTLRHVVDTSEGQSGAPLYIQDGGRYWAIGIHSKEAESGDSNVARLVTDTLMADVERWRQSALTS